MEFMWAWFTYVWFIEWYMAYTANREGCHNKYFANKQTHNGRSREPGAFAILISVRAVQCGPFVSWGTYYVWPLSCKKKKKWETHKLSILQERKKTHIQ